MSHSLSRHPRELTEQVMAEKWGLGVVRTSGCFQTLQASPRGPELCGSEVLNMLPRRQGPPQCSELI